jgi:DNA repair exonuclease SbcCD ATPase subunit
LIEGLNEAGKSTLFEAIYFALYGEPLVAEETGTTGRGQYASVINYHADQATVVLGLEVEGTQLEVERILHPKRSTARLLVTSPDGAVEEVRNVRPVNQRVLDELGGLDKEALLNSCFVEQKKLAKLEELRSEDRRVALE